MQATSECLHDPAAPLGEAREKGMTSTALSRPPDSIPDNILVGLSCFMKLVPTVVLLH